MRAAIRIVLSSHDEPSFWTLLIRRLRCPYSRLRDKSAAVLALCCASSCRMCTSVRERGLWCSALVERAGMTRVETVEAANRLDGPARIRMAHRFDFSTF